jgi:hypothetical protein
LRNTTTSAITGDQINGKIASLGSDEGAPDSEIASAATAQPAIANT